MAHQFTTSYIEDSLAIFRQYKAHAEKAFAQLDEAQLIQQPDEESNSIAQIVKHMAGNMRSRWTDFLTTDGEKPDRNRDSEFEVPPMTRAAMMQLWDDGWATLFAALEPLADADMSRTITIRGEAHSVMQAIQRQVAHYAMHIGQIVFLAKHLRSHEWKSISVPRNRSAEFNAKVAAGEASQR
jgi:hypothetical protein